MALDVLLSRLMGRGTADPGQRGLHVIVFSKDRACQLDSLLRSIRDHFRLPRRSLTVLHRASGDEYAAAYRKLVDRHILPGIRWAPESSFSEDLRSIIGDLPERDRVMFLVDDDVVVREFGDERLLERFTSRHLFVSLRCSRRYPVAALPRFISSEPFLEWRWRYGRRKRLVWNYPFSLDGNVHHVAHIKRILRHIAFQAPNSLEGRMHAYRHAWWVKRIPLALAPAEAVVVNNPLNRVQTEGETWHRDIDPAELNRAYLDGKHIDNAALYAAVPTAVHSALPLQLVERSPAM